MRLARFTTISGIIIATAAVGLATYGQIDSRSANAAADALVAGTIVDLQHSRDLTHAVDQVKVDVIQVQQWLTDISATRGLDGLNDGYAEAESYAQKFPLDLAEARRLATEVDQADVVATLGQVEAAFPDYYTTGKAMAAGYIAQGPAGGNPMMAAFDTAAARIAESVDTMEAAVNQFAVNVGTDAAAMQQKFTGDQSARAILQLATYGLLILAIAAMTAFMSGYILRRIRAISWRVTAIAKGDYSQSVHGSGTWQEFKDIAAAADIFRENGLRLNELSADEALQREARRAERQKMMQSLQQAFGRVVEATIAGDFTQRVPTSFVDPELNSLAQEVNTLVSSMGDGLAETATVLESLARFDLTARMSQKQIGAFAALRDDTNAVAETLSELIAKLRRTSGSLRTATSDILTGANDLSDRTTRQAATIEQTSAAMEKLATAIERNSRTAVAAGAKSQSVSLLAQGSEAEMVRATGAMQDISTSSAKVQNFIGVIDDIAFQTNLLALNASVEAARAGDAGKGFAVVAIEVRRLAQAAATAANEAKSLVDVSMTTVASGRAIIADVAERLSEVTHQVVAAAVEIDSIAAESKEQASAVKEVTVAIRQMDEMTQHNAALVEETNAAIEQTENQAQALDELIGVFRLGQQDSRRAA